MKKTAVFLAILCISIQFTFAQSESLEQLLFELPDVSFKQLDSNIDNATLYELRIKQPIDHNDTSKGYFHQRVYLTHKNYNSPTVIITQGYNIRSPRLQEISYVLDANQIEVEHRYFGESMPENLDYNYLNLEQATADLHHINTLFKRIYKDNKWVSSGISKGGATTIFYRYFYPEDVDVSVPYVAPINVEYEDKRLYKFLDNVGSKQCRKDIEAFQKRVLKSRVDILPLLEFYSLGAGATYNYLGFEEAFEYAVLEYPFSFWQYGADCNAIPDKNASASENTKYLNAISDITFFGDDLISAYGSHYYQSATEMGYYGYETKPFKNLLKALPTDSNPHATFMPNKMKAAFNGDLLDEVNAWLKTDANKMIYIYGSIDTWTGTGVTENKKVDSQWFVLDGKHHGNARIKNFNSEEMARFKTTISQWLNVNVQGF
ncbi:MAG: hypothetical protein BM564_06430 [Bacteroidetes bacterium MedPE-SWsnd-G2]|nr:MAG: hypothetical protein BM564_06430 [Bacteroidetes bacterium MedPE-SWsnd-G2]